MKLAIVATFLAVAILGSSALPQKSSRGLQEDLDDFLELVPTTEVIELALQYLIGDDEFQDVIAYVTSDDFKDIVVKVDAIPQYIEVSLLLGKL